MESLLFKHGFYTFLFLLQKLEKEERFEDCKIVLDIINQFNEKYLPHEKFNLSVEDYKVEFWRLGYNGNVAVSKMDKYVDLLEVELKLNNGY